MKYAAIIGIIALCAAGALYALYRAKEPATPQDKELGAPAVVVSMTDDGYSTSTISLRQGDIILFRNDGSEPRWPASDLHPTHEIYSDFDPRQPLEPEEAWSFKFDRCGMWRMHDHLRPSIRGVINVACAPQAR